MSSPVDLSGELSHRFVTKLLTSTRFVKPFTSTPTTYPTTNGAQKRA